MRKQKCRSRFRIDRNSQLVKATTSAGHHHQHERSHSRPISGMQRPKQKDPKRGFWGSFGRSKKQNKMGYSMY